MNALQPPKTPPSAEHPVADIDPDVLALAEYLARSRRLSVRDFLEYLITKEACKGNCVEI